ncbi:ribulose-bisphosphate carboxylase large subunit family protein [Bradyrhizobium sp. LHD-71]|uniref:ribulose-bisphosphate carboxylase large subunit family protein n=1 Tax=Bradyrhizobium sp. LHD-71 TaxID=3072141 RepID=UPI0028104F90|nr:ribulose-bisphosphate carboxylase large subunit family protein [Bradyrhizobium sp. LHD-71]MDQ8726868.1 ribulose-bisphosphate carboxylase large subunit family protein [Bradyrhizobium sp. LHD-71]
MHFSPPPDRFNATYLIETPLDLVKVADIMAGEQSCGTFARVEGETDLLRERARATVTAIEELVPSPAPSLPNAWLARRRTSGPYRRARVTISFPIENVGVNLATLAAVVAGNLYDLGEVTGLRLDTITLPFEFRRRFARPAHGIVGTRKLTGVAQGPLVGSIIKPNVGLSSNDTAALVARLCAAGLDFIKDDEVCADPAHAPLAERIPAVMAAVRRHQDATGKAVMVAFNITDETDAMRRHADAIAREHGTCAMVSLNWCGFSAVETLRRSTDLVLHGHRNGFGAFSRHPLLGISFQAYQTLWRLAGVDHMHVHGVQGKFAQDDEEVASSARDCVTPLTGGFDDRVLPAFSSGQWAGTAHATFDAVGHTDVLFLSGGGIMAHPGGPAAGVTSIRQAWDAVTADIPLNIAAQSQAELRQALDFFGTSK